MDIGGIERRCEIFVRVLYNAFVVVKWDNMNCGQVYCEKVGNGQKLCNCANSQFGGGGTHRQGRYGYWMLNLCGGDLHNAYFVAKYEVWPSMFSKKLPMVKDYVIVHSANSQFFCLGGHTDKGDMNIGC